MIFLVEGCGQNNLGKNWGDGLATDPAIVQQRGINSAASLFSQLMKRSYLNQVVVAPHVYPPSISTAKEETTVSPVCESCLPFSFSVFFFPFLGVGRGYLEVERGLRLAAGGLVVCQFEDKEEVVAPHVNPPSISSAKEETTVSCCCCCCCYWRLIACGIEDLGLRFPGWLLWSQYCLS